MELLNPAALWGLLALAVLFLLPRLRLPRRRLAVANVFLWRDALTVEQPRFTAALRRNLLLILQAAAVFTVVLALARPLLLTRAVTVAIVIDLSASMGARDASGTRLDAAKRVILDRARALPFGSRVRLMTAGHAVATAGEFGASSEALRQAVEGLQPSAGTAALLDGVATARAGGAREIVVVTDRYVDERPQTVNWVVVGSPQGNVAIAEMAVRPLPASPLDAELLIVIRNFGAAPPRTLAVRDEQRELYRRSYSFTEDEGEHRLALRLEQPHGLLTASIGPGDALAVDDTRFVLARPRPRTPVTLVTSGSFFLERALATNPAVSLRTMAPGPGVADVAGGVIVCDGCAEMPSGTNGVLLIARPGRNATTSQLTVVDARHALTSHLALSNLFVRATPAAAVPADATVLARAGGTPALAVFERAGRRVAVLSLDVQDGALPLDAAFPILIARAIEWLGESAMPREVVAGEPMRWPAGSGEDVSVTAPDGTRHAPRRAGEFAVFGETSQPGLYTVASGGLRFVANAVARDESDLRQTERRSQPAGPSQDTAARAVPIAGVLLALAALVVLLEWRVYCRQRTA